MSRAEKNKERKVKKNNKKKPKKNKKKTKEKMVEADTEIATLNKQETVVRVG